LAHILRQVEYTFPARGFHLFAALALRSLLLKLPPPLLSLMALLLLVFK